MFVQSTVKKQLETSSFLEIFSSFWIVSRRRE